MPSRNFCFTNYFGKNIRPARQSFSDGGDPLKHMLKKFLIGFVMMIVLVGIFSLSLVLQYRDRVRQERQNAKAPQQSITLLEGWNNNEIGDYLEKNNVAKRTDFLSTEKSFSTSGYSFLVDKPAAADLQGYIFPDTYFIPKNPNADINTIIVKKALDNFEAKFTPAMANQAAANKLSIYQIITLASIVEK